jgi:hypothetical protein
VRRRRLEDPTHDHAAYLTTGCGGFPFSALSHFSPPPPPPLLPPLVTENSDLTGGDDNDDNDGLNDEQIALIAIVGVIAAFLLLAFVYLVCRNSKVPPKELTTVEISSTTEHL